MATTPTAIPAMAPDPSPLFVAEALFEDGDELFVDDAYEDEIIGTIVGVVAAFHKHWLTEKLPLS